MRKFISMIEDHSESLSATIGTNSYTTMMFFQPVPSYYGRQSYMYFFVAISARTL